MQPFIVAGWRIIFHPIFQGQLSSLYQEVTKKKRAEPERFHSTNCAKRLAAILKLVMIDIPADPGHPKFRQGDTLGSNRKHWYRAKFFQQYRLFYRFDSRAKIIVFAWVNDETSLRAYGNTSDAYAVFARMLASGNPPDDFPALLKEADAAAAQAQSLLKAAFDSLDPPPV